MFVDIFNCAIFCPVYSLDTALDSFDIRHDNIRTISNTLQQFSYISRILNLVPLALERCIAISLPLKHRKYVTEHVVLTSITLVWLTSFCMAVVYGCIASQTYIHVINGIYLKNFYFMFTCVYHATFVLLCVVHAITFYKSRTAVKRHYHIVNGAGGGSPHIEARRFKSEKKLLRVSFFIFAIFFMAFLPTLLFKMLLNFLNVKKTDSTNLVNASSVIAMALSSCINPLIIMFMKVELKVKFMCRRGAVYWKVLVSRWKSQSSPV